LEESETCAAVKEGNLEVDYEYVFDYFANVFFQRQSKEEQRALLYASILPDLNPDVVSRLCGWSGAGQYLHELSQKNYFTHMVSH
jgi:ATP/maltotriose-dependent transcriptional regulator MalT